MAHELIDPSCVHDVALSGSPKENISDELSPVTLLSSSLSSELSLPELAAYCLAEIDHYRTMDEQCQTLSAQIDLLEQEMQMAQMERALSKGRLEVAQAD